MIRAVALILMVLGNVHCQDEDATPDPYPFVNSTPVPLIPPDVSLEVTHLDPAVHYLSSSESLSEESATIWRGNSSTTFARGYPVHVPVVFKAYSLITFGALLEGGRSRYLWLRDAFNVTNPMNYSGAKPTPIDAKGGFYGAHFHTGSADDMMGVAGINNTFLDLGAHKVSTLTFSAAIPSGAKGTLVVAATLPADDKTAEHRRNLLRLIETTAGIDGGGSSHFVLNSSIKEVDARTVLNYGVFVDADKGSVSLLTKPANSTSVQFLRFRPGRDLFDGKWHLFGIRIGEQTTSNLRSAQLVVDVETTTSSNWRRCLQKENEPIPFSTSSSTHDTTTSLFVGGVKGSKVMGVSAFHRIMTQVELVSLGSSWMEKNLSLSISDAIVCVSIGFVVAFVFLAHSLRATTTEFSQAKTAAEHISLRKRACQSGKSSVQKGDQAAQRVKRVVAASNTAGSSRGLKGTMTQYLRLMAMMGTMVIGIIQGMNIYFRLFSWPSLFRNVYEYLTFFLYFDVSLPEFGIPIYATLVLQLVGSVLCVLAFAWFNKREYRLFEQSLMRYHSRVVVFQQLIKMQLSEAGTRVGRQPDPEAVQNVVDAMIEDGIDPNASDLQRLGIDIDIGKEAVHIMNATLPTTALSGLAMLFSLARLKTKLRPADADKFASSVLTAEWLRESPSSETSLLTRKSTRKQKKRRQKKVKKMESTRGENVAILSQIEEFMSAACARNISKSDNRWLVAIMLHLAHALNLDVKLPLEQEQDLSLSTSVGPEQDTSQATRVSFTDKEQEPEEWSHKKVQVNRKAVVEEAIRQCVELTDEDAKRIISSLKPDALAKLLRPLTVLQGQSIPEPPSDGAKPSSVYEYHVVREDSGEKFTIAHDNAEQLMQLEILRRTIESMVYRQESKASLSSPSISLKNSSDEIVVYRNVRPREYSLQQDPQNNSFAGSISTLPPECVQEQGEDHDEIEAPSLAEVSDGVQLILACEDEDRRPVSLVVTHIEHADGMRCPQHRRTLIPAVEDRHFLVTMMNGKSPYVCTHDRAAGFKYLRDGATGLRPCTKDKLLVCPIDTCCYTICNTCANNVFDGNRRLKLRGTFAMLRYKLEHSPSGVVPLMLFILIQALQLPVMQTAIMIISCHPQYQCLFPDCYFDPSPFFILSVVISILLLVFFRMGTTVMWMKSLIYRKKRLDPHIVSDHTWDTFLSMDNTLLSAIYSKYEFKYMLFEPLYLLAYQTGIVLATTITERDSLMQLACLGGVEILNGALLVTTSPFIEPLMDGLIKFGSIHQLIQVSLAGVHQIEPTQEAAQGISAAMLLVACLYFTTVGYIFYKSIYQPWQKTQREVKYLEVRRRELLYLDELKGHRISFAKAMEDLLTEKRVLYKKSAGIHLDVAITEAHLVRYAYEEDCEERADRARRVATIIKSELNNLQKKKEHRKHRHRINGYLLNRADEGSLTFAIRQLHPADRVKIMDALIEVVMAARSENYPIASTNCFVLYARLRREVKDLDLSGTFLCAGELTNINFENVCFDEAHLETTNFCNSFFHNCSFESASVRYTLWGVPKLSDARTLKRFDVLSYQNNMMTPTETLCSFEADKLEILNTTSGLPMITCVVGQELSIASDTKTKQRRIVIPKEKVLPPVPDEDSASLWNEAMMISQAEAQILRPILPPSTFHVGFKNSGGTLQFFGYGRDDTESFEITPKRTGMLNQSLGISLSASASTSVRPQSLPSFKPSATGDSNLQDGHRLVHEIPEEEEDINPLTSDAKQNESDTFSTTESSLFSSSFIERPHASPDEQPLFAETICECVTSNSKVMAYHPVNGAVHAITVDFALKQAFDPRIYMLPNNDLREDFMKAASIHFAISPGGTFAVAVGNNNVFIFVFRLQSIKSLRLASSRVEELYFSRSGDLLALRESHRATIVRITDDFDLSELCAVGGLRRIQSCHFSWDSRLLHCAGNGIVIVYDIHRGGKERGFYICYGSEEDKMQRLNRLSTRGFLERMEDDSNSTESVLTLKKDMPSPPQSDLQSVVESEAGENESDDDDVASNDGGGDSDYDIDREMDVCVGHDTQTFLTTNNKVARIVDSKSTTIARQRAVVVGLDIDDKSSSIAAVLNNGTIQTLDVLTGRVVTNLPSGHPHAVAVQFMKQSSTIFCTTGGRTGIRIWEEDKQNGVAVRLFSAHFGQKLVASCILNVSAKDASEVVVEATQDLVDAKSTIIVMDEKNNDESLRRETTRDFTNEPQGRVQHHFADTADAIVLGKDGALGVCAWRPGSTAPTVVWRATLTTPTTTTSIVCSPANQYAAVGSQIFLLIPNGTTEDSVSMYQLDTVKCVSEEDTATATNTESSPLGRGRSRWQCDSCGTPCITEENGHCYYAVASLKDRQLYYAMLPPPTEVEEVDTSEPPRERPEVEVVMHAILMNASLPHDSPTWGSYALRNDKSIVDCMSGAVIFAGLGGMNESVVGWQLLVDSASDAESSPSSRHDTMLYNVVDAFRSSSGSMWCDRIGNLASPQGTTSSFVRWTPPRFTTAVLGGSFGIRVFGAVKTTATPPLQSPRNADMFSDLVSEQQSTVIQSFAVESSMLIESSALSEVDKSKLLWCTDIPRFFIGCRKPRNEARRNKGYWQKLRVGMRVGRAMGMVDRRRSTQAGALFHQGSKTSLLAAFENLEVHDESSATEED